MVDDHGTVGHSGSIAGYASFLGYLPDSDTVVVVWHNSPPNRPVAFDVLDIVADASA